MTSLGVSRAIMITTSRFTKSALVIGQQHSGVRLINGQELVYLIRKHLGIIATLGPNTNVDDEGSVGQSDE
jgi:restriction endonuclease Mrr